MSIFSTKQDLIKMKTITLFLALFIFGITAQENCPEEGKKVCPKAMDLFPKKKPDNEYCNRMEYYETCLGKVKHGCAKHFSKLHHDNCIANSTASLPGIMKPHIIFMIPIISTLV
ncbi:uncharacterized protein LOC106870879 [Octopus bimaculoides]|nr:uncharacterized protein LOC106870879 [Octopus bimaculoides]|eukprot:XP_014772604.1 PREDICTED: uncharacterized protein LOC106870879 [Octopus bimaculoides]